MSGSGRRNEAHAEPNCCEGRNARGEKPKSRIAIFSLVSKHEVSGRRPTPLHRIHPIAITRHSYTWKPNNDDTILSRILSRRIVTVINA